MTSGHQPARWLRFGLWALLAMVMASLALVWWVGSTRVVATSAPPVLFELPDFELVDSAGAAVDLAALRGRPWVADFVFTRCAVTCPRMTSRMRALGERLPAGVRRVSISADPAYDTPQVLAEYAASYGVTPADDWLFLTGAEAAVQRLAIEGFKLGLARTPEDAPGAELEPITHSTRFVLVDGDGRVRGYYDAFEPESFEQLVREAATLAGGTSGGGAG